MPTYEIIRTRRKTVALVVKPNGQLVVRAPLRATKKQIQQVVEQQAEWIRATQEKALARYHPVMPKQFTTGEEFWFLGKLYRLEIVSAGRALPARLVLDDPGGYFLLDRQAVPQAQHIFTLWYRQQAARVLEERVSIAATRHKFSYAKVKITSARTRWGSCSARGTLSFPWRLVMAPLEVIDYVVLHELVHTRERSHARRFWEQVQAFAPDYKQHIKWLKENGHLLRIE
jgi:predicted metal-dependent hydrolase